MKKISTGEPSTLKTYRNIALALSGFDENNPAVKFIDEKIAQCGEDEEVISDESQMLFLLSHMALGETNDK